MSGDHASALDAYRESIVLTHDHGDRRFLTNALAGIACVAAADGQPERAARLYGATAAIRVQLGLGVESWQRIRHERAIAHVRSELPSNVFDTVWQAGEVLPIEAVVAEALATVPAGPSIARSDAKEPVTDAGLTPRELDVLRLLARGLQDRQIADELFISSRTASFHVANLLGKLGVGSRAAAAAYAVRQRLD
jgi:non-specific serine/threonine protein kinase